MFIINFVHHGLLYSLLMFGQATYHSQVYLIESHEYLDMIFTAHPCIATGKTNGQPKFIFA
jgi:hypothetical protein